MRSEKSPVFLSAFFFLLIFSFISGSAQASSLCSSSCGDIQNISYPFRLKDDPLNCGDPDYELSCQNNKTILEFLSGKYYVKNISYEEHKIRIVDINFVNESCGLPYKSTSVDEVSNEIRYAAGLSIYRTYITFINCSKIITDPEYAEVPCLSRNTSSIHVYAIYDKYKISDLPIGCVFVSMALVNRVNVAHPSYEAIQRLLESGFDLWWSIKCRDCFLSNSLCELTSSDTPLICLREEKIDIIGLLRGIRWWQLAVEILFIRNCFAALVILVFVICKCRKERKKEDKVERFLCNELSLMPKRYSYIEIVAMTNHFRDKLGKGGFGSVYKGQLPGGYSIAVKMLENTKFSGEEFINEVSTIGRIHHVNVVKLVGFCSDESKRALVYEYMPNGSLEKYVFSNKERALRSFGWEKLLEIALGTARGIEYLHCGCDVCIIHFDIKPHNVLLDEGFIPKVADFGLAKFFPKENDFVSISTTRGTIGYIAPELISRNFGAVSSKSDVYSFGMLLLEMAGTRRKFDGKAKGSSQDYFPSWVYHQLVDDGGDLELQNVSEIEIEIARKLCIVGLWCIQMKASDRPSMTKVVEMLEGNINDLEIPPKPFLSSPQNLRIREPQSDFSAESLTTES